MRQKQKKEESLFCTHCRALLGLLPARRGREPPRLGLREIGIILTSLESAIVTQVQSLIWHMRQKRRVAP